MKWVLMILRKHGLADAQSVCIDATTLAATATVPDLLKVARNASSDYYLPFVAYGLAALLYLCVSFALIRLFRSAERKWLAYLR